MDSISDTLITVLIMAGVLLVVALVAWLLASLKGAANTTYPQRLKNEIGYDLGIIITGAKYFLAVAVIVGLFTWVWSHNNARWDCSTKSGATFQTKGKPYGIWIKSLDGVRYPQSNIAECEKK